MLKIRLQRVGRKHEPTYRLVLTDSKNSTKSGRYIETLGNFDSRRGEEAKFNNEKVEYWMSKGAQLSPTVHNMLVGRGVIEGKKVNKLPLKKAIKKEAEVPTAPESAPEAASDEAKEETPAETEATPAVEA